MAKKRAQQQQAGRAQKPDEEAEGEPAYAADEDEVRRYLESIGVKVERRAPPSRAPAPPPEPEPVVLQPIEEEPYQSPGGLVVEEAPPPAPPPPPRPEPQPVRVVIRQRPPRAPRPEPVPPRPEEPAPASPTEPPAAPAPAAAAPVAAPLTLLGGRPGLSDLRRAVVLSEILRRPDFSRLPSERELI
jgi:hypothetical protein